MNVISNIKKKAFDISLMKLISLSYYIYVNLTKINVN